jgi:hypothetical protein
MQPSGSIPTEHYIHYTRGRLRVRSPLVKNNDQRAASAVQWLRTLPGVSSAEANTLTGSLTVRYDPAQTGGGALLDALKEAGYVGHHAAVPIHPVARAQTNLRAEVAAKVAKTLAAYAIEQAVVALVTALL